MSSSHVHTRFIHGTSSKPAYVGYVRKSPSDFESKTRICRTFIGEYLGILSNRALLDYISDFMLSLITTIIKLVRYCDPYSVMTACTYLALRPCQQESSGAAASQFIMRCLIGYPAKLYICIDRCHIPHFTHICSFLEM